MILMWPLPLRNARSSCQVSCPEEGLFNNTLRTLLTSQLDGAADVSVMVVEDWESRVPSRRCWQLWTLSFNFKNSLTQAPFHCSAGPLMDTSVEYPPSNGI